MHFYKRNCDNCGLFYKGRGRGYCSVKCRFEKLGMPSRKGIKESKEIREKKSVGHRGKKAYNWKGGLRKLKNRIRGCFKYRQWRLDIYVRDKFTCILCGYKKGNILEADHFPVGFSEIINKNKIKNLRSALSCCELWDITNGRTLCINCHKKTNNYGRRKKQQ